MLTLVEHSEESVPELVSVIGNAELIQHHVKTSSFYERNRGKTITSTESRGVVSSAHVGMLEVISGFLECVGQYRHTDSVHVE